MSENGSNGGIDARSIYAGVLLAWVIALVMLVLVPGPRKILHGSRAFGWRKHVCIVQATAFDQQHAPVPALLVTVRYEVDGRPCQTTCRLSGDSRRQLQDRADLFLRPGDEVDCRINPRHHAEIMLDDEYVSFEFFLFAAVALTVVCAVAAPATGWWLRRDKPPVSARLQFLIRKIGVMFVCGFILVFCGTATVTGFRDAVRMFRSLGWPEAEATIQVSSVTKVRKGKSWGYQLDLRYAYDFDGKRHEATRWSLFDDGPATPASTRKALARLKEGDVVICYVNPVDPAQAVLDRWQWWFLALPLLPVLLAMATCGFWSALREKPPATPTD